MILFGNSAQKAEIKRLKGDNRYLTEENVRLEDKIADADIKVARIRTDNRLNVEELVNENKRILASERAQHGMALDEVEADLEKLEESFDARVEKEVSTQKKDLKNKEKEITKRSETQDRTYNEKMRKLENEHIARKIKNDKELESDKVSYRKYLRGECGSKVENLEKENKRLVAENAKFSADHTAAEKNIGRLESQNKSLTGIVEELSKNVGNLSGKIVDGLVKSMPTISAEFTTPETPDVNVNLPSTPAAGGNKQGGGEQKK